MCKLLLYTPVLRGKLKMCIQSETVPLIKPLTC